MRRARPLARLALAGALLAALILWIDPARVADALAGLSLPWLLVAAACVVGSTLLGAVNALLLLGRCGEIGWRAFLPIYWSAWAMGLVVPGQVGDVAAVAALLRHHRFEWHAALGRSLLDKLISFAVIAAFAGAGLASFAGRRLELDAVGALVALVPVAAIVLAARPLWRVTARVAPRLAALLARTAGELAATAREHPRRVGLNIVLTVAKVAVLGLSYWAMFRALGQELAAPAVIALAMASALVAYLPVSFNGLGTVELAGVVLFGALGVGEAAVLAAYLCLRAVVLAVAWLPASIWLLAVRTGGRRP